MAQSALVRDYWALETGRRRANRLVLSVAGEELAAPNPVLPSGTATAGAGSKSRLKGGHDGQRRSLERVEAFTLGA
jgi:hypothetical protein